MKKDEKKSGNNGNSQGKKNEPVKSAQKDAQAKIPEKETPVKAQKDSGAQPAQTEPAVKREVKKDAYAQGETVVRIFQNDKIKAERIISRGAVTPRDKWIENTIGEFVTVSRGSAEMELEFVGKVELSDGEGYFIKPLQKHRVVRTSNDCEWLCVYIAD